MTLLEALIKSANARLEYVDRTPDIDTQSKELTLSMFVTNFGVNGDIMILDTLSNELDIIHTFENYIKEYPDYSGKITHPELFRRKLWRMNKELNMYDKHIVDNTSRIYKLVYKLIKTSSYEKTRSYNVH